MNHPDILMDMLLQCVLDMPYTDRTEGRKNGRMTDHDRTLCHYDHVTRTKQLMLTDVSINPHSSVSNRTEPDGISSFPHAIIPFNLTASDFISTSPCPKSPSRISVMDETGPNGTSSSTQHAMARKRMRKGTHSCNECPIPLIWSETPYF